MFLHRLSRKNRGFRFTLAILFAALTFAAGGPHEHDRVGSGAATAAITAAHDVQIPAPCPLCQWATASYQLPVSAPILTAPLVLPMAAPVAAGEEIGSCLPVPHRGLRAPPYS